MEDQDGLYFDSRPYTRLILNPKKREFCSRSDSFIWLQNALAIDVRKKHKMSLLCGTQSHRAMFKVKPSESGIKLEEEHSMTIMQWTVVNTNRSANDTSSSLMHLGMWMQ